MDNKSKHTPTPWHIAPNDGTFIYQSDIRSTDEDGFPIISRVHLKDNAKYIVKCVNHHEELVKCLNEISLDIAMGCYFDMMVHNRGLSRIVNDKIEYIINLLSKIERE